MIEKKEPNPAYAAPELPKDTNPAAVHQYYMSMSDYHDRHAQKHARLRGLQKLWSDSRNHHDDRHNFHKSMRDGFAQKALSVDIAQTAEQKQGGFGGMKESDESLAEMAMHPDAKRAWKNVQSLEKKPHTPEREALWQKHMKTYSDAGGHDGSGSWAPTPQYRAKRKIKTLADLEPDAVKEAQTSPANTRTGQYGSEIKTPATYDWQKKRPLDSLDTFIKKDYIKSGKGKMAGPAGKLPENCACPKCGSHNTSTYDDSDREKCKDCGHTFVESLMEMHDIPGEFGYRPVGNNQYVHNLSRHQLHVVNDHWQVKTPNGDIRGTGTGPESLKSKLTSLHKVKGEAFGGTAPTGVMNTVLANKAPNLKLLQPKPADKPKPAFGGKQPSMKIGKALEAVLQHKSPFEVLATL